MTRRARPLLLYVRSRRIAASLAAAAGSTAALWVIAAALDDPAATRLVGRSAVALGVAAASPGLAGADIDLDRTAAIDWRPRRVAHVVLVVATVVGMVAATRLTGRPLGPVAEVARNAVGAAGLLTLAASSLGASRAWIPLLLWTTTAAQLLEHSWSAPRQPGYAQILTWPVQMAESGPALLAALVLGIGGTAAYAVVGPRT